MFYIQYLTSLCNRRSWAEPEFDSRYTRQGWVSCVRVNNREYNCDGAYQTEKLAREKAAEAAYFICYNFSVNDGLPPGQRAGQAGVTQGRPVAIGTGRRTSSSSGSSAATGSGDDRYSSSRHGNHRGSGSRHHHSSASSSASQAASRAAAAAAAFAAASQSNEASVSDESEYDHQYETSSNSSGGSAALAAVAASHSINYGYINHQSNSDSKAASKAVPTVLCACGRSYTPHYSLCGYCLREAGYY